MVADDEEQLDDEDGSDNDDNDGKGSGSKCQCHLKQGKIKLVNTRKTIVTNPLEHLRK